MDLLKPSESSHFWVRKLARETWMCIPGVIAGTTDASALGAS